MKINFFRSFFEVKSLNQIALKQVLPLLFFCFTAFTQSYKLSVGSNNTTYLFTNSAGINASFFRPSSGLHLGIYRELAVTRVVLFDFGINYNQFNNEGDIQNIPFRYSTDFIGFNLGVGPRLNLGKGIAITPKINVSIAKMIKGNQFIQNRYFDLSGDQQFSPIFIMSGYSFELSKKVNSQMDIFVKYQHLDSYKFGNSTLNIIPSTYSIGLSLKNN